MSAKRPPARRRREPRAGAPSAVRGRAAGEGAPASRSRIAPQELVRRAAGIRLVLLDVDGVLTDGRLYYGPDGEALKAFDVRDGHGVVMLRDHVDFGVISGRPGKASQRRLEELRFKHLVFGERDKLAGFARLGHLGIPDEAIAYMGDDVNDVPLLRRVGLSACPADAAPEAREAVHFVTSAPGGRGAVRELCELVLKAKGLWSV